jgi:hypothetical protein
MAKFVPAVPVVTDQPVVVVDPGLPPGVHRFRLVVVNDKGNESQPDVLTVQVIKPMVPVPGSGPH